MVGVAEVAVLRRAQGAVVSAVERDLAAFVASLDLAKPGAVRNALLEYVPLLVRRYGEQAAVIAAEWYDEVRASEAVGGRFRARPAPLVDEDRVLGKIRSATGHLWSPTPALVLPALVDPLTKYVLEPARMTIVESTNRDPRTSGWQRVTRPGSCKFCRGLASRGGVYREATAGFAAHGHCGCAAVPSWDADAPEVDVMAYQASRRTAGMSPSQRESHAARTREWLASEFAD